MELNGVANIKIALDVALQYNQIDKGLADDIYKQLETLERYMLAYADHCKSKQAGAYGALIVKVEEPLWHEVRENPEQFPLAKERIKGFKKQMAGE